VVHPKSYGETENPFKVVHETPNEVATHVRSFPVSIPASLVLLGFVAWFSVQGVICTVCNAHEEIDVFVDAT
jgi:hypothetical protein